MRTSGKGATISRYVGRKNAEGFPTREHALNSFNTPALYTRDYYMVRNATEADISSPTVVPTESWVIVQDLRAAHQTAERRLNVPPDKLEERVVPAQCCWNARVNAGGRIRSSTEQRTCEPDYTRKSFNDEEQ